ncbi:MAG: hypothetical protein HZB79_06210 [Deltaproteobacteria bacterium]|nr:hypothetical protein [Deltaproteobacteria bacterium]
MAVLIERFGAVKVNHKSDKIRTCYRLDDGREVIVNTVKDVFYPKNAFSLR